MLYSVVLFLGFSVAACGGGGSGGGGSSSSGDSASTPKNLPVAQSVIDQSNYVNIAAHAYLAPENLAGLTRLNDMLAGVSVDTKVPGLAELATDVLRQLVDNQASTVTAVSQSAACPGGGTVKMSGPGDSLDNMQPGDVVTVEASNCGVSGLKINGGLRLTLKEGSAASVLDGASQSVMQFRFSSLSLASATETALIDGDMTARYAQSSAGDITVVLSGDSLRTMLERDGALVTDHTLLGFESAATATIAKRTASRNYTLSASSPSVKDVHVGVKTVTPFVYEADINPVSGSMLVTGAASSVTVTAVDADNVRLDLSARGDGVITATRTVSWPEFQKAL